MKFTDAGLALLKEFEGCKLTAYQDQGGRWTIGFGTAIGVKEGDVITQDEAEMRLLKDVSLMASRVSQILVPDLNDNQFSALVCFAYNVGCGNLAKSTLLNCLNKHQIENASGEFLRWDKISGVPNEGLLRRRKAEQALFMAP